MQYTLQQRRDRRVGKLAPTVVTRVVRLLAASSVTSLLDHDEGTWLTIADGTVNDSLGRALLLYARRAVADLAETGGWEAEYPRDIWRMHRLGFDGRRTLQFDRITQPWLRELAKRWVRLRLSSGLGLEAGGARAVVAISRFSRFLAAVGVEHIEQLDRQLLERYLADLGHERHPQRRSAHIGLLNGFFVAIRQHRWHPGLPATALFFPADHPRRPDKLPRALAEQVMTQLEQPANLDRFDNPSYRLITVILMHCGLRVTDALRLRSDCVTTDTDGAPYLRYFNHKMHRDALVPIDTELADAIGHQRHRNTRSLAGAAHGSCSRGPARTSTAATRSAPRPIGWPCSAGSMPATSATNTATGCVSRRINGVTPWAPAWICAELHQMHHSAAGENVVAAAIWGVRWRRRCRGAVTRHAS